MVDRSLTFYEGEDLSPSWDVTDLVKWEEAEFGTRAWRGESTNTDIPFRDEQSRTSHADNLPAGLQKIVFQARNTLEFVHGSNVLWRGRIANQSYTRGAQKAGRAREGAAYLEDINIDLRGIVVHGWARPAETDVARLHGLIASYLSGSPRRSTIVNGSNLINAGSNVITLPAKTYDQTDPRSVIEDVATQANKTYYLLPRRRTTDAHTAELFYDGNDAVMELCPFRISDHPDEVKAQPDTVFAPIWNVGAAGELTAQETLSGVWLFYGADQYVHVSDSGVADITAHWEEVIYDDTVTTEAEATAKANAIVQFRRSSVRRINVTIGPLGDQHIDSIRAGQRITIQAMAVPWADDQRYDANIGQLKITTPLPGIYFAHLELERPLRMGPYSVGDKAGTVKPDICYDPEYPVEAINWNTADWEIRNDTNPAVVPGYLAINVSISGDVGIMEHSDTGELVDDEPAWAGARVFRLNYTPDEPEELLIDFTIQALGWTGSWEVKNSNSGLNQWTNFYGCRVIFPQDLYPNGAISAVCSSTPMDESEEVTEFTWAEGQRYKMRLRHVSGTTSVRVWTAGSAEPSAWTVEVSPSVPDVLDGGLGINMPPIFESEDPDTDGSRIAINGILANGVLVAGGQLRCVTGGPDATSGDATESAAADHDHDSVDNGDAAGGDLSGTYPNPTVAKINGVSVSGTPSSGQIIKASSSTVASWQNEASGSAITIEEEDGTPSDTPDTLKFPNGSLTDNGDGSFSVAFSAAAASLQIDQDASRVADECWFETTTSFYAGRVNQAANGTGAGTSAGTSTGNHPGVIRLSPGTTTTGRCALSGGAIVLGGGIVRFGIVMAVVALSDGTNTFTVRLGLSDSSTGDPTDGVFFRYTHSVNSGNWEAVCRDGGSETASDTGVAADTSYHTFAAEVNAGGTSVEFFIDGSSVATIGTNVPTGSTNLLPGSVIKSAGTSIRPIDLDAYWFEFEFTTSR